MAQDKFVLSAVESRVTVRDAIVEVCSFRAWRLYALHVRTEHVHGLVEADCAESKVLNDWKAYATRALRTAGLVTADRRIWTHGGDSRQLQSDEALRAGIRYVIEEQGSPMELWSADTGRVNPAVTGAAGG